MTATTVHQVVSTLAAADAVGNEVLQVQAGLRHNGYGSDIFVAHRNGDEPVPVRDLDSLFSDPPPSAVVYHVATTSVATARLVEWDIPLVVVYHNVTPPEYFYGIDRVHWEACTRAIDDLAMLRDRAVLAIGHSDFSRAELRALGFRRTAASPLVLDLSRLDDASQSQRAGNPMLLTVGRIAPNKRIEDLLRMHAALRRVLAPDVELWIAGERSRLPSYARGLVTLSERLGSSDSVRWLGSVSDGLLAHCYRNASLYVSMSEHEGFGAPLVEAMHCELPVLARAAGAIPETVGDAGVLLSSPSAMRAAEVAASMLRDGDVRSELVTRGRRRAGELAGPRSLSRLLGLLANAVPAAARR